MEPEKAPEWFSMDVLCRAISSSLRSAQDRMESDATGTAFMIADFRIDVPVFIRRSEGGIELCTPGGADADPLLEAARKAEGGALGRVSFTLRPMLRG